MKGAVARATVTYFEHGSPKADHFAQCKQCTLWITEPLVEYIRLINNNMKCIPFHDPSSVRAKLDLQLSVSSTCLLNAQILELFRMWLWGNVITW